MNYMIEASAQNNLRAEIFLGLKKGYAGFAQEKQTVLDFLIADYKAQFAAGAPSTPLTFNVREDTLTYAYPTDNGVVGEHEPALVIVADKNPIYGAHLSEAQWMDLVRGYADALGIKFEQWRVYLAFSRTVQFEILKKQG